MTFALSLLFFIALQLLLRGSSLTDLTFLNEDSALILEGIRSLKQDGVFHWFVNGYGPSIIRPWQLLWLGSVGQFSTDPLLFYITQIFLLSLGQTLLFTALKKEFGTLGALIAATLPGISRGSAESIYWLSSGHDLFLLIFGALSLIFVRKSIESDLPSRSYIYLLVTILALFGALLANEKAATLPIALSCYLIYQRKKILPQIVLLLSTIPIYFLYRRAILGTFIGGYTDKVLGDEFLTFTKLISWLGSTFTALFWQSAHDQLFLYLGIAGLGLLTFSSLYRSKSKIIFSLLIWIASHIALTLPTAQFALPLQHSGVFNTRMYWTAVLSISIAIGGMTSLLSRKRSKLLLGISSLLILSSAINGTLNAHNSFLVASNFTSTAISEFREHCTCADPALPQTTGFPKHVATVNTFTQQSWLEDHLLAAGFPRCTKETPNRCSLDYVIEKRKPVTLPLKTSLKVVNSALQDKTISDDRKKTEEISECFNFTSRRLQKRERIQVRISDRANADSSQCEQYKDFIIQVDSAPQIKLRKTGEKALFRIPFEEESTPQKIIEIFAVHNQKLYKLQTINNTP